jgi:hypothetical protein
MNIQTIERVGKFDNLDVIAREYTVPDNSQLLGSVIPQGTKRVYEFNIDGKKQIVSYDKPDIQNIPLEKRENLRDKFLSEEFNVNPSDLYGEIIEYDGHGKKDLVNEFGIYRTQSYWENLPLKSLDFLLGNKNPAVKEKRRIYGVHAKVLLVPQIKTGEYDGCNEYQFEGMFRCLFNTENNPKLHPFFIKEFDTKDKMVIGISTSPGLTASYDIECFEYDGKLNLLENID